MARSEMTGSGFRYSPRPDFPASVIAVEQLRHAMEQHDGWSSVLTYTGSAQGNLLMTFMWMMAYMMPNRVHALGYDDRKILFKMKNPGRVMRVQVDGFNTPYEHKALARMLLTDIEMEKAYADRHVLDGT